MMSAPGWHPARARAGRRLVADAHPAADRGRARRPVHQPLLVRGPRGAVPRRRPSWRRSGEPACWPPPTGSSCAGSPCSPAGSAWRRRGRSPSVAPSPLTTCWTPWDAWWTSHSSSPRSGTAKHATGSWRRSASMPPTGWSRPGRPRRPGIATSPGSWPSPRPSNPAPARPGRLADPARAGARQLRAALDWGLAASTRNAVAAWRLGCRGSAHIHRQGREGLEYLWRAIERAPDDRSTLQARLLTGIALVADTAKPARPRVRRGATGPGDRHRAR